MLLLLKRNLFFSRKSGYSVHLKVLTCFFKILLLNIGIWLSVKLQPL